MRDPVRSAIIADMKAWTVGCVVIMVYLTAHNLAQPVEKTDLHASPVTIGDNTLHQVSQ